MSSDPPHTTSTLLQDLARVEQDLQDSARQASEQQHVLKDREKVLKKVRGHLAKVRDDLASKPRPAAQLTKLISALSKVKGPGKADVGPVLELLERHLRNLKERREDAFAQELRARCEAERVAFRPLDDGWGIGPFDLHLVPAKEVAMLKYARQDLEKDLALDPGRILERVRDLEATLLALPRDLKALAAEVQEALRVAVARQGMPLTEPQLRADLPATYREMVYVRQGRTKAPSRATFRDYPLHRFIVELKALLQSEENLHAARRLKLEPAVIEHAKDTRKSLFFPNDLSRGYGEGTYYQALVLLPPS
jgi:hypothetical protein